MNISQLEDFRKILIVRLSSLGDILLTTPLVRTLKNLYPSLQIDILLREEYKSVYLNNPYITGVMTLLRTPDNSQEVKAGILAAGYDLAIDLQNNLRSLSLLRGNKCKIVKYKKERFNKILLVKFKVDRIKDVVPVPEKYAAVIEGLKLDTESLDYFTPYKKRFEPGKTNMLKIGFCPGARHFTKKYPQDYLISLITMIHKSGIEPVLLGGEGDRTLCLNLADKLNFECDVCIGDLDQIGEAMNLCSGIVCNDSGLMHLACAVRKPTAVFFGSTVKQFGFTPYKNKNLIIENNLLSCRPCSHIGREKCPEKHFKCMLTLKPAEVFPKLMTFFQNND